MDWFTALTRRVEWIVGNPWSFIAAAVSVLAWLAFGPYFQWSDTYQLVANTFTTLITYLLVFIIQATQTRDTTAIQAKLDALVLATEGARNRLVSVEEADQKTLDTLREEIRDAAKEDQ